jgi:type I restriction enzyme S subunit
MQRSVTLDEIAAVFNGKTPSQEDQRRAGFPVLKIKDVDESGTFVGAFDSFVDRAFSERWSQKIIQVGDTLILNAAHNAEYVGSKTFFVAGTPTGALATGEWLIIRPKPREVHDRFLYYWTSWANRQMRALVKGIHLYPRDVAQISMTLPDLAEQKRIAAILQRADRLRRLRRYGLEMVESILPATFLRLFGNPVLNSKGWPASELEGIARVDRGKFTPRPRNDPSYYGGPFPFFQTGDISQSGGRVRSWRQTLNEKGKAISRSFPRGTIVIAIVGATIGATAILDFEMYCPDSVVGIQVDHSKATADYLEFLLRFWRPVFVAQAPETARANINLETLRPLRIPIPPVAVQKEFSSLVTQVHSLQVLHRESLRQAEHLFQTLLQRAFTSGLSGD